MFNFIQLQGIGSPTTILIDERANVRIEVTAPDHARLAEMIDDLLNAYGAPIVDLAEVSGQ
jgi:hypothetical protein